MIGDIKTRGRKFRMGLFCDTPGCDSRFFPRGSADSAPGGAGVEFRRRAENAGWSCAHPLMGGEAGNGSDFCQREGCIANAGATGRWPLRVNTRGK